MKTLRSSGRSARQRRAYVGWGVAAALGTVAVGIVVGVAPRPDRVATEARAQQSTEVATVKQRDLANTVTFQGVLAYADERDLEATTQGTLTKVAGVGHVVRRGETLYQIDDRATRLLFGRTPLYRALALGVDDGDDVLQLERNLAALGHDPDNDLEIDEEFDAATYAAIRRWQDDVDAPEDGVVDIGEVVFLPGPRRVANVHAELGDLLAPASAILETSSATRTVTVEMDAEDHDTMRIGQRVDVSLPTGKSVTGTINSIGSVAQSEGDEDEPDSGEASEGQATLEVLIRVDSRLRNLDLADVVVAVETIVARDALSVPVHALLALAEGGYAVEVVTGAHSELVAVEPGHFAGGWVSIEGDVLEGDQVVVPQ